MPYHHWREKTFLGRSDSLFSKVPYIVAGTYGIASAAWILFSDRLLAHLASDYQQYQEIQTYKGWLFISVSALLILVVLKSAWAGIFAAYATSVESERRLHLALTSAGGGVWELNLADDQVAGALVSPELCASLGLPGSHRLTMGEMLERRHPDDVARVDRALQDFIASNGKGTYEVRYRLRANDGSYRWVHSRGNIVADKPDRPQRMLGVSLDITDQMEAEERVRQLLRYDPLTGLAKQKKFLADVDKVIGSIGTDAVLAMVQLKLPGLDNLIEDFETVEDAGIVHTIGDRLHALTDSGILASRISPDTFAVATPPLATPALARSLIKHIVDLLAHSLQIGGRHVQLRLQAGAAMFPQDGDGAHVLLRNCRHALDNAGAPPEAWLRWFTEGLDTKFRTRNDRLRDLSNAVANGEIECHFQPLVDLSTARTAGFEALARWHRKSEGLVTPDQFIGLAEEHGWISGIGEEMLRQACNAAASWESGADAAPFVAVNVSPVQLADPAFPALIARALAESGLSPRRLELEITENVLTNDPDAVARRLETLRQLGVSIALDDFGTGYSSLALLSKLPFNRLKIDRSFITNYGQRHESTIIVDMIVDLCRHLDLSITAEGVETGKQAELLLTRGVSLAQGYLFSPAVHVTDVSALVGKRWSIETGSSVANVSQLRMTNLRQPV